MNQVNICSKKIIQKSLAEGWVNYTTHKKYVSAVINSKYGTIGMASGKHSSSILNQTPYLFPYITQCIANLLYEKSSSTVRRYTMHAKSLTTVCNNIAATWKTNILLLLYNKTFRRKVWPALNEVQPLLLKKCFEKLIPWNQNIL